MTKRQSLESNNGAVEEAMLLLPDLHADKCRSFFREVACIAKLALARKVTAAEAFASIWPGFATASREIPLQFLAFLHAICQSAFGAHVGLAHHDVEPILPIALLEFGEAKGQEGSEDDGGELHCLDETRVVRDPNGLELV